MLSPGTRARALAAQTRRAAGTARAALPRLWAARGALARLALARRYRDAQVGVGAGVIWLLLLALHLFLPALLLEYAGLLALCWLRPRAGVWALLAALPLHTLLMTVIYNAFGAPVAIVTAMAAWKEVFICLLLAAFVWRAWRAEGGSARGLRGVRELAGFARTRRLQPADWVALALAADLTLQLLLPTGAAATTLYQRFYGFKVYAPLLICYGIGRALALDARWLRRTLVALLVIGALTGIWAVVEYVTVPLSGYVALGYVRYLRDVAHLSYTRYNAPLTPRPWWALPQNYVSYGLPENFATSIGDFHIRRAVSVYLSSQVLAISYLLFLPLALPVYARFARSRRWVALAISAMTAGLLLTLTRGAILALVIAGAVIAAAYLARGRRLPRLTWRVRLPQTRRARLLLGGALVAALVVVVALAPIVGPYLTSALTLRDYSVQEHLTSWQTSLSDFARSPWLGNGLGSVGVTDKRFSSGISGPENQYLQIGEETGLVTLALYLALLALGLARTWRNWSRPGPRLWRTLNLALFAALIAIAFDSLSAPLLNTWILTDLLGLLLGVCMRAPASIQWDNERALGEPADAAEDDRLPALAVASRAPVGRSRVAGVALDGAQPWNAFTSRLAALTRQPLTPTPRTTPNG